MMIYTKYNGKRVFHNNPQVTQLQALVKLSHLLEENIRFLLVVIECARWLLGPKKAHDDPQAKIR